jgi:hypothetical protein
MMPVKTFSKCRYNIFLQVFLRKRARYASGQGPLAANLKEDGHLVRLVKLYKNAHILVKKDTKLVQKTQNYIVNTSSVYERMQLSLFEKSNDLKFD